MPKPTPIRPTVKPFPDVEDGERVYIPVDVAVLEALIKYNRGERLDRYDHRALHDLVKLVLDDFDSGLNDCLLVLE